MKRFLLVLLFAAAASPLLAFDDHNPIGVTGAFEGVITTGCAYNVLNHNATRQIDDIVVPGSIGKYPLKMTRYYNSRSTSVYGIMGAGWRHEYSWSRSSSNDKVAYPNGNVWDSHCTDHWGLEGPLGVSDWPTTWNGYPAFRLGDGGTVVFENPNWGVATKIIDPYGQETNITLGANGLITRVTEPGGRYLQFTYSQVGGQQVLSEVDAYDGRGNQIDSVVYHYASKPTGGTIVTTALCLTSVDYSDSKHATYTYTTDNSPENPTQPCPCPLKLLPLLQTAQDVRYKGPMRQICYEYQANGPHGAIIAERYSLNGSTDGPRVSRIDPPALSPLLRGVTFPCTYTEYRGDGPTRTFNYTALSLGRPPNEEECPSVNGPAPQQFLQSYSDFQGHTTYLGYDPTTWYVTSVRDANQRTTYYDRGPPPNAYPGPKGTGQILKITYPGGAHIDYAYYGEGSGSISGHYLQQITNERGAVTYHFRDGHHRITRTDYKDANGNLLANETFSYNSFGQVLTHRLKNGAYVHFKYDNNNRGLLVAKTNPTTIADWQTAIDGAPKTTYIYYVGADGKPGWIDRVKTMTLPANVSNNVASGTYEYDLSPNNTSRGLVTKIQHADGKYQSFFYDAYGNKLWQENELRKRTSYTYDDYNRLTSTTEPLQNADNVSYLKPGASSEYRHTTNSVYTYTSPAGIVTTNGYDENWRKTSTVVASGTLNLTTRFAYDLVGNLTDVTDPRSKIAHHVYDNRNRKTSTTEAYGITGLAATTAWHYDAASNINQIDRPDGIHETNGFDALNRMTWHTVPRQVIGGGQINVTTNITYNPSGTIQKVRDANGRETNFSYDASDRKIMMTYPGTNGTQQWAYDNAGNLKSRTTVRGGTEIQRFEYDNRNRKISMRWDNGADSASYGYDDAGRLTSAINPNSTVTRVYDAAGRLTNDQQNVSGLGIKNVTYPLYDDDGRVKQISAAGVYDYTFGYDAAGRFETISIGASLKFQYAYDAASNETHRYAYLPNSVTIDQVYNRDSLNRMASRVLKKNGTTIPGTTESYTYDHMNRITQANRAGMADDFRYYWDGGLLSAQYGGEPDAPYTEEQEPDLDTTDTLDPNAGYQPPETAEAEPVPPPDDTTPSDLTPDTTPSPDVTQPSDTPPAEDPAKGEKTVEDYLGDGNLAPDGPETDLFTGRSVMYNLDKAGNRTSVTDNLNGNATYAPNNLNQYTSVGGSSVTNGPEHEIRTYNSVTYNYVNDEHLKQVTSSSSTYNLYYDALGRCVKRTLNGFTTYYIYDGEKPIMEYRSSDLANPAKNVYGKGIDEILMRYDPSFNPDVTYYYQQDHEGSVTQLLNTSGNVIESYKYDAFGAPAIYDANGTQLSSSAYSNRFLFTGREYANVFGFYEYRARAYHPTLGRFMSEDPKLFDAGDYNLFRYCHNDPLDFTDPMGLDTMANAMAVAEAVVPGQYEYNQMVASFQSGNYVNAAGWGVTWVASTYVGVASGTSSTRAQASFRAARIAASERQVTAVLGKFENKPNFQRVAEHLGVKSLNIPQHIYDKMTPAQQWAANQKMLDRAIARGGDFLFDKPIKDINSITGGLRKELNYLSEKGFKLSLDGWSMTKSEPLVLRVTEDASTASKHIPLPEKP